MSGPDLMAAPYRRPISQEMRSGSVGMGGYSLFK